MCFQLNFHTSSHSRKEKWLGAIPGIISDLSLRLNDEQRKRRMRESGTNGWKVRMLKFQGKVHDKYACRCLMRITASPQFRWNPESSCLTAGRAQTNFRLGNRSALPASSLSSLSVGIYSRHRMCRTCRWRLRIMDNSELYVIFRHVAKVRSNMKDLFFLGLDLLEGSSKKEKERTNNRRKKCFL